MEDETFDNILHAISSIRLGKICLYLMNEPLADPFLFQRIKKVKSLDNFNMLELSTNALLLSVENSSMLINELNDIKHEIWISFHGTNEENYKKTMGLPFNKVLSNIDNFLKESDGKLNIKINGAGKPQKGMNHPEIFSEQEYHCFWNSRFKSIGLKNKPEVKYFQFHNRAGNVKNYNSHKSNNINNLSNFTCNRTNEWVHFAVNGEVILCCMDYEKKYVFGNINHQSYHEISNSKIKNDLIDQIEGNTPSNDHLICKKCMLPEQNSILYNIYFNTINHFKHNKRNEIEK